MAMQKDLTEHYLKNSNKPSLLRKRYESLKDFKSYLDRYLYFYNFQRTHQGYKLKGLKPCNKLYYVSDLKALKA